MKNKAKVNLFLHVVGKEGDMHSLESVACFANDVFDVITIHESDRKSLTISGTYQNHLKNSSSENIILRSLTILEEMLNVKLNFHYHLEKNIPIAAGLGGGSGNAASAIKLALKAKKIQLSNSEVREICQKIGADVFLCYKELNCFFRGIGDEIQDVTIPENFWILLVNNNIPILTQQIFTPQFSEFTERLENSSEIDLEFLQNQKNDLEERANEFAPIKEILNLIQSQENCIFARMSGSGATCFGVFLQKKDAEKAMQNLNFSFPNWWIKISSI